MIKHLSAIAIGLTTAFAPQLAFAQDQGNLPCGASQAMEELIKQDPSYGKHLEMLRERSRQITQAPASQLRQMQFTDKVIPVVVHIMHDYGNSNITREQVIDAMRVINEDFNKQNADTSDIIPAFAGIAADAQIEFRLANIDPSGNCTDGITRTYTELTNTAGTNVKDLIRWNPAKYLNVWVVNSIASGAGGYSYIPCVSNNIDGIVIRHSQFGSIGTSGGNFASRSFTHEAGHYLGLPHTWGPGNEPGLPSNCNIDDGIADTPNTIGVANQSCNLSASTCGGLNNVQNYMDYSNCSAMFTLGQKIVMQNVLEDLSCRTTLWDPSNLLATGTNDGFTPTVCAPKVDFNSTKVRVCEGDQIVFRNHSYGGEVDSTWTYEWSFPGGTPSTSTLTNPFVTYDSAGTFAVTLTVTNAGGTNSKTIANYIQVISTSGLMQAPVTESFESVAFPLNPTEPQYSWEVDNSTTTTWERTTSASVDGNSSMRIRHSFIPTGRVNNLVTPNLDVSGLTQPVLRFSYAYAKASPTNGNDQLRVYFSPDCGSTWTLRYAKAGNALLTTTGDYPNFIPTTSPENQWAEAQVNLPASGLDHIMLKFESTSAAGNTLYLDAVRIESMVTGAEENLTHQNLEVFPNPSNGNATIRYEILKAGQTSLVLTNAIGKTVYSSVKNQETGVYQEEMSGLVNHLSSGVYILRLQSNGHVSTQKVVIN